ncbi:response regulator [Paenibacillus sp.]|uniref:response regulator n=1 Tax=Paenibacillus sp. TaxID=58172 RepID=UPI002D61F858|nr:response regulator [Paenibacillus sp.]HZG86119.1 response regulator [Paenibacillus sp.]
MESVIDVLIVEDEPRIADIHRRFAEKLEGFRVVGTAATGEEAKEWLSACRPHLVLLDVYLPDMRGVELVAFLRGEGIDADVIMITAASETDVVRQALQGGAFDYIVKPLTFERFKSSLERYKRARDRLRGEGRLTPEQIEELWPGGAVRSAEEEAVPGDAPKGIDPLTLERVLEHIRRGGEDGVTAEALGAAAGLSRSTARRYLEYLVSARRLAVRLNYGTIGRPERRYVVKTQP